MPPCWTTEESKPLRDEHSYFTRFMTHAALEHLFATTALLWALLVADMLVLLNQKFSGFTIGIILYVTSQKRPCMGHAIVCSVIV